MHRRTLYRCTLCCCSAGYGTPQICQASRCIRSIQLLQPELTHIGIRRRRPWRSRRLQPCQLKVARSGPVSWLAMGRCFPAGEASMIRSRLAAADPRQVLGQALQLVERDRPAERCRRRHNRVHSAQAACMVRPTTAAWWRIILPAGPWSRQTCPWGRNRTAGRPENNRWPCRWPAKSPVPCHTEPGAGSW